MGLMDKLKDLAKMTDEGYFEEAEYDDAEVEETAGGDIYEEEPQPEEPVSYSRRHVNYQPADRGAERSNRVVDMHAGGSRSQVVFKKLDKYENVREVADELNAKKIVVLNLETCPSDVSRRILDFLCGVAYANSGDITRVAVRTYIITPYNVPVTGERLDQAEGSAEK